MGRTVLRQIDATPGLSIAGAWVHESDGVTGKPVSQWLGGGCGVVATLDAEAAIRDAAVVVDFTLPAATATVLDAIGTAGKPLVSGTTGIDDATLDRMRTLSASVPILYDRNMSSGVHVMCGLARKAAELLGDDYDVEIVEAHHRRKIDAPSGTALKLGRAVAAGRGVDLAAQSVYSREGSTVPREQGTIGFAVVRGGGIVGEHSVQFLGETERLEIAHQAFSRDVFAAGAIRAARWLVAQPPGFYGLPDALGIPG